MGLLVNAVRSLVPSFDFETKARAIASAIPTWQAGAPQYPLNTRAYERLARQAYMADELIFACCRALAKTATEPRMVAFKTPARDDEAIEDHPALNVLMHPNKFWTNYQLWSSVVISMKIAGNAYIEKVRSKAGKVVEYWPMRPDRIRVIPDYAKFIRGYEYRIGSDTWELPPEDVIHFKDFHPLDDYYGLPPLAVLSERADIDVWSREFALAFFRNAGVPSGMLNIMRSVEPQERELLKQRFRQQYGGPQGWGNILVIDSGQATYTQMGMGLGANGLALSELNQINEAKICSALDVPPSIVWTVLGHSGSALNQGNKQSDREHWWQTSVHPMYVDLAQQYTLAVKDDYHDIDRFEFDVSDVPGMGQDVDAEANRVRQDFQASLITLREARVARGYSETPDESSVYMVPVNIIPTQSDTIEEAAGMAGTQATPEAPAEEAPDELEAAAEQPALPPGNPANSAAPGTGSEGVSVGGQKILRVIKQGGHTFDVIAGCTAETFNEHWRSRELHVCVWCDTDPLEAKQGTYDYSSTQINLPAALADSLMQWERDMIETADLGSGGFEDEPHCTVKFGLQPTVTLAQLRAALRGQGPVRLTFGRVQAFAGQTGGPSTAAGVPLYMEVDSPDLATLHALLGSLLPNVETHVTYQPHVTLAYVNEDAVVKYVGKSTPLSGQTVTCSSVRFSQADGTQTDIALRGGRKALGEGTDAAGGVFVPADEPSRRRKKPVKDLKAEWMSHFAVGDASLKACVTTLTDNGVPEAEAVCTFWYKSATGAWPKGDAPKADEKQQPEAEKVSTQELNFHVHVPEQQTTVVEVPTRDEDGREHRTQRITVRKEVVRDEQGRIVSVTEHQEPTNGVAAH